MPTENELEMMKEFSKIFGDFIRKNASRACFCPDDDMAITNEFLDKVYPSLKRLIVKIKGGNDATN